MSILAFTTVINPVVEIFFIIWIILLVLGIISTCISFYMNLKTLRNERVQGKQTLWYKRPGILSNLTMTSFYPALILISFMELKILPTSAFLVVIAFILMGISLIIAFYTFKLSMRIRRLKQQKSSSDANS